MYEQHYHFTEKPFGLTPDPKYLYASDSHVKTLARLQQAIGRRECFAVVTGDVGTGKTMLCRALVDQADRKTLATLLLNPPASEEELLRELLASLGIVSRRDDRLSASGPTRQDLTNALQDFLESLLPLGASAVLVIDEAHHMSAPVLDLVRVLSLMTANKETLLQVVLVGPPALGEVLRAPELRHLDQRLSLRCELRPMTDDETNAYILHRLAIADPTRSVTFTPAACQLVYRYSNGIPRIVNLMCHRALMAGSNARATAIGAEQVTSAAEGLELKPAAAGRKSWFGRLRGGP